MVVAKLPPFESLRMTAPSKHRMAGDWLETAARGVRASPSRFFRLRTAILLGEGEESAANGCG